MGVTSSIYRALVNKSKGHQLRKFKIVRDLDKMIRTRIKSDFAIIQGSKMYLGDDDRYSLSIFGIYESKETEFVKKEIEKGYTVLDLGASIGYYTLLFSRLVGNQGKVYSFELNPNRFHILEENVRMNGYTNVILENKAVSNKNGESIIYHHKAQTVTLDSYFQIQEDDNIDFIKIDVEGHEKHVFEGMKEILRKNPQVKILFEFHPQLLADYETKPQDLLNIIDKMNFQMFDILEDKPITSNELLKMYPNKKNTSTNIFCTRK